MGDERGRESGFGGDHGERRGLEEDRGRCRGGRKRRDEGTRKGRVGQLDCANGDVSNDCWDDEYVSRLLDAGRSVRRERGRWASGRFARDAKRA